VALTQRPQVTRAGEFQVTAAYTWSHLIDTASEIFGQGVRLVPLGEAIELEDTENLEALSPFAQDPRNTAAEKGNSAFDRRHRLTVSYVWELPGMGDGVWRSLVGNWKISGITTLQSGQPFSPLNADPFLDLCEDDANGDGREANDRPHLGNPSAPADSVALLNDCFRPGRGYFNPGLPGVRFSRESALANFRFVQAAVGETGSAGRNILHGPALINFDLGVSRIFRWGTEANQKSVVFRWEIYNLFNRPNAGLNAGNAFTGDAQPPQAFLGEGRRTISSVAGVIPEHAIDAHGGSASAAILGSTFLGHRFLSTTTRRMQFGLKFVF